MFRRQREGFDLKFTLISQQWFVDFTKNQIWIMLYPLKIRSNLTDTLKTEFQR